MDMEDSNGYFAERDTTRGGDQRLYAGLVVGREGHIFLHCSAYNCYAVPNWRVPTYIERYYRFDNYVYKINTRTGNVESKTCTHNNAGREERHFTSTVNAEQGVLYVLCDDDLQLFGIKEGEYEQPDLTINAPTVRSYSNQVLCTPDNKLLLDAYSILDLDNMQVRRVDSPVSDPHSIIAASFDNLGSNMFAFVLYNFFSDPKYSATLYRKFDTGQIDMQADSEEASQVTIVDKDGRMFTVTDVAQIKEAIQSVLQSQQPEVRPAQVEELAGAETCA